MGDLDYGTDPTQIERIANQVPRVAQREVEVAIVVGAGNIYRGLRGGGGGNGRGHCRLHGHARHRAQRAHSPGRWRRWAWTPVCSRRWRSPRWPSPTSAAARFAIWRRAEAVIFAAGTGNPFFTTDTAAALQALEIHAEAILMAKNGVEGVYTADPSIDPTAEFLPEISHRQAIERGLRVMDSTALSLCMDNDLPIYVFNMADERNTDRLASWRGRDFGVEQALAEPAPKVRT